MDKLSLRKHILQMRGALPAKLPTATAQNIGAIISALQIFQDAQTIMLYKDFRNEAGTGPLLSFCLKKGKKVVLPLTDDSFQIHPYFIEKETDLILSPLGILEPDPQRCTPCLPEQIDLILLPGAAFDVSGNRLGYGKGCYDRLLPLLHPEVPRIGLAYDFQVLPHIPSDPQDQPVDAIVTEKGLLLIKNAKNLVK